jgi:hypothetical protein
MSGALSDGRLKWHLKCAKFGKEGAVRAKTGKDPSGGTDFELFLERGKKKWKATDGELYTSVCACVSCGVRDGKGRRREHGCVGYAPPDI